MNFVLLGKIFIDNFKIRLIVNKTQFFHVSPPFNIYGGNYEKKTMTHKTKSNLMKLSAG